MLTEEEKKKIEAIKKKNEEEKKEIKAKAEAGDAIAQYLYSRILKHDNDIESMFWYLRQAAKKGVHEAKYTLAYHYYFGEFINRNVKKAMELCKEAIALSAKGNDNIEQNYRYHGFYNFMKRMVAGKPSQTYRALYKAIRYGDFSMLEPLLDENVAYHHIFHDPVIGKDAVISWFKGRSEDPDLSVSYVATERYGTVVETFHSVSIHAIFIIHTNKSNKIDKITSQPITWTIDTDFNGYYINSGSKAFSWKQIKPFLDKPLSKSVLKRGHMFCMGCGKRSEDLLWINFWTKPDKFGKALFGVMSVCPDCKQEVEFCPDRMHQVLFY